MAGFMESVATINSAVRTLLAVAALGLMTVAGWWGYSTYYESDLKLREQERELEERNRRITALEGDLERARERVEQLETAVRLLKVDHRKAYVRVVDQGEDESGKVFTTVEFFEVNDQNKPISQPQQFTVAGKVVHISGWIVKFEDRFIESADPDRGTSLFVFKSLYGDEQRPIDGFPLDEAGRRPVAYSDGKQMSDFEKRIWDDFWGLAHDKAKAESLGVRASHGTTVFIQAQKGATYRISLRASDGLSLITGEPDEIPPPVATTRPAT